MEILNIKLIKNTKAHNKITDTNIKIECNIKNYKFNINKCYNNIQYLTEVGTPLTFGVGDMTKMLYHNMTNFISW